MAENKISMPSGMGGLMRYSEEYKSPFQFSPTIVIVFVILVIAFVVALKYFFPIA